MKISTRGRYALRLMIDLAMNQEGDPVRIKDVATRQEIHRLLRKEAEKGKAVLYVSSDLTELLEIADEVAVMAYGKVRKTFENKDLKPADVLACCYEAEREENDR